MPYAHSVKRVTISGTSFGGAEIWSTGFYMGSVGSDVSNPTQAQADAIRTAWTAFFTSTNASIHSNFKTDTVKVAQVLATGKTSLDNVVYAPYGTAIAGNSNGSCFPPQVSLAVTLANSGARGLAAKGRMYLPGVALAIGTNARIADLSVTNMATEFKKFLDAVNAAASIGERVILASQGHRVKGSNGKYTPVPGTEVNAVVNTVRVGNVYDTQRRRRDGLVETYQTAALV
jgi:hypothetical protein